MNIAEKVDPFGLDDGVYEAWYSGNDIPEPIQRPKKTPQERMADRIEYYNKVEELRSRNKSTDNIDYDREIEIIKAEANAKEQQVKELIEEVGDIFNIPKDEVKIPLPTHVDIIKGLTDKEYIIVGALSMLSNFEDEKRGEQNYIYRNKVDNTLNNLSYMALDKKTKEFKEKKISKRTVERYIKKLETEFGLVETVDTPHGIAYKINYATDSKYYTTIPFKQLNELVTSTNSTMLKLYSVLSYQLTTTDFKEMDRWYLAEQIGLSSKADDNLKAVGRMTKTLAKLGFIEIRKGQQTHLDEATGKKIVKTPHYYRLRTYEEYLEIDNCIQPM